MSSISAATNSALSFLSTTSTNSQNGQTRSAASLLGGKKQRTHKGGDLLSQIQSVVSGALSKNKDASTDPNTAITTAISNLLKQGGATPDADGDTDNSTTSTPSTGAQTFADLLAAHGVSTDAFRADLQTAFTQSQGASTTSTNGNLLDILG